jgi:S-adenosylmethionine-diacylglycerol 3-amino-3-carboxypropyl transferase
MTGGNMTENKSRKVELHHLLFTNSWEDPDLDREAFGNGKGKVIATVTSGACNSLTFLLDDPARIFAFDYNPHQVRVLELKKAAFQTLEHGALLELFGVRPSSRRENLLRQVLPALTTESADYWKEQKWLSERGLLNGGRYERFVSLFNLLLRTLQGKRRLLSLFEERDRGGREIFYRKEWNRLRWRLLFKVFFNKTMMSMRGLSADYFHFDDGSRSFAENFSKRTEHAMVDLPVRANYFLAQYALGYYLGEEYLPDYLLRENFKIIRERVGRVEAVVGDVRDVFDRFESGTFDGICLSNVFEMMSQAEADEVLPRVARVLKPGGALTLRNLIIPRKVPAAMAGTLDLEAERSHSLHQQDRSFAYRSFQIYARR